MEETKTKQGETLKENKAINIEKSEQNQSPVPVQGKR